MLSNITSINLDLQTQGSALVAKQINDISSGIWSPKPDAIYVSKYNQFADYADLPAAIAALPATGGTIILDVVTKGDAGYTAANITIDNVSIIGLVPPVLDFDSDIIANDCAVIDGQVVVTGSNFCIENVAIRTNTVGLNNDGLELNGGNSNAVIKNLAVLGYLRTSAFHCLLIETYNNVTVDNLQTINNVWGVAIKSSNVSFSNHRSKNHDFGPLIVKGDSLTGTVENINCNNVSYVSTADGSGNYKGAVFIQNVHSTSLVKNVNISNLVLKNGIIRLENLDTSPDLGIDNVNFCNVVIDLPGHSSRNVGVQINDVSGSKNCYGSVTFENTQITGAFFFGFYDLSKFFKKLNLGNNIVTNQPNIVFRRNWKAKLFADTTDNTSTRLTTDGKVVADYNYLKIPSNTIWIMTIDISGVKDDVAKAIYWKRVVVLRNDGGVVTSDLAGGSTSLITTTSIGAPGYSIGVAADDTNNAIDIQVVGATAENVSWVACVDITEIQA